MKHIGSSNESVLYTTSAAGGFCNIELKPVNTLTAKQLNTHTLTMSAYVRPSPTSPGDSWL